MTSADLLPLLQDPSPKTVFAPSNQAFATAIQQLGLTPEEALADKPLLIRLLSYHVTPGAALSSALADGQVLPTLLPGGELTVVVKDSGVFIQPSGGPAAKVITPDIVADNGVVHIVDTLLLPVAIATAEPAAEPAAEIIAALAFEPAPEVPAP